MKIFIPTSVLISATLWVVLAFSRDNIEDSVNNNTTSQLADLIHSQPEAIEKLNGFISVDALKIALEGWQKMEDVRQDRLVIIDFSLPSTTERFYLINPETGDLLYKKLVAHGQGTGLLHATEFSNKPNSQQSSLGFFKTAETYNGKHGHSLRLDGLEHGLNHKARERAVVIHEADYVSEAFIRQNGYLGRSWGCPALPAEDYFKIIDEIKGGTLVLIYHPSLHKSSIASRG